MATASSSSNNYKKRNRLDQRHNMQVALSCKELNFADLIADKQEHPSH